MFLCDGPSHTAPFTSLRDQKTLCELHMGEPGTALSYLKHSQIIGCSFFFFYSAQFCKSRVKSVLWSQCLQCFVAAFLLWVGREGYIEVDSRWVRLNYSLQEEKNIVFQLMCQDYAAITFSSQSLVWTTTMGIPFSYCSS